MSADYRLVDVPLAAYLADPSAYWMPRCPQSLARRDSDVDRETIDGGEVAVVAYRGSKAGSVLARHPTREREQVAARRAEAETAVAP